MNFINQTLSFLLTIVLSACANNKAFSQESELFEPPVNVVFNERLESYSKYDTAIIKAAKWLESNSLDKHVIRRRRVYMYVISWIENTPKITNDIYNKKVLRLFSETSDLVGVYLANYSRWVLENKDSFEFNLANAALAGVRAAMSCYLLGGVNGDSKMKKLIQLEKTGNLHGYIRGLINK